MPPKRGDVWEYFHNTCFHPSSGIFGKPTQGDRPDKQRTYCVQCYDRDFALEKAKDLSLLQSRKIEQVRSDDEVRFACKSFLYLFSSHRDSFAVYTAIDKPRWCAARADTMRNHIKKCPNQPLDARAKIEAFTQEHVMNTSGIPAPTLPTLHTNATMLLNEDTEMYNLTQYPISCKSIIF